MKTVKSPSTGEKYVVLDFDDGSRRVFQYTTLEGLGANKISIAGATGKLLTAKVRSNSAKKNAAAQKTSKKKKVARKKKR